MMDMGTKAKRQWMPAGDAENVTRAWAWLDHVTATGQVALLVVPTKDTLDGMVAHDIGDSAAKALARGELAALPSGGRVAHLTERVGAPRSWAGGSVLVAWGTTGSTQGGVVCIATRPRNIRNANTAKTTP